MIKLFMKITIQILLIKLKEFLRGARIVHT